MDTARRLVATRIDAVRVWLLRFATARDSKEAAVRDDSEVEQGDRVTDWSAHACV
jgi:hypothetical protein